MTKPHLILVDDEEEILNSLRRIFRTDYKISAFTSAEEFLAFAENNSFDIVLSDIRMPYMDGFELMENIRERYPEATRLCISGYADMERCQKAIEEGLFEFIFAKPWENFEIKQILGLFVEIKMLRHRLVELENHGQ